jgi:hypothetical protein
VLRILQLHHAPREALCQRLHLCAASGLLRRSQPARLHSLERALGAALSELRPPGTRQHQRLPHPQFARHLRKARLAWRCWRR